jgi:hypothetical protein
MGTINAGRIGDIIKADLIKWLVCQHIKGNGRKLAVRHSGGILIGVIHRVFYPATMD